MASIIFKMTDGTYTTVNEDEEVSIKMPLRLSDTQGTEFCFETFVTFRNRGGVLVMTTPRAIIEFPK